MVKKTIKKQSNSYSSNDNKFESTLISPESITARDLALLENIALQGDKKSFKYLKFLMRLVVKTFL